jgi:hypothetical protein
MVEHILGKDEVMGSIPIGGSNMNELVSKVINIEGRMRMTAILNYGFDLLITWGEDGS